ncbi:MAG: nucleoside kinase [Treponema sp.]|jgi:uridine kinase|nr:nucleoside kinase [Treponema sp.]
MNEIRVTLRSDGEPEQELRVPSGTRLEELAERFHATGVAMRVNNEILPLAARLEVNARIEMVPLDSSEGVMIYRRSLAFLLAIAAWERFPERNLQIGHSLGNSYYYTFAGDRKPAPEDIRALEERMRHLAAENLPIEVHYLAYEEAVERFEKNRLTGTSLLLEQRSESLVQINVCKDFVDLYIEPLVNRTGILSTFNLLAYQDGFLLRFPGIGRGMEIERFEDSPRIFAVYNEYKKWGRIIGVHTVGHLNRHIANKTIREFIRIAEAFQARKLSELAEQIYEKRDAVKLILLAGPSSSGKTTTAKRLSIELKIMGLEPEAVSLDDYYVNVCHTPRDEKGEPDYECLEALDTAYLNEQLRALLNGEEVILPSYDFKAGRRREEGRKLRMGRRTMLIVEGIHGLNDALTPSIGRELKFKIYLSALTQLNLDDHNRIPTSDNRLLRRLVRDYQFRGSDAVNTIKMWPSVQRGERRHIFPFQNSADAAFNSALDYELAVLKPYAVPLLRAIKPNRAEYAEAARLLAFLKNFAPIPAPYVPSQSIVREFIGGSEFSY